MPAANLEHLNGFTEVLAAEVRAVVVQVHESHRWYRAAWETPAGAMHECFKF